MKLVPSLLASAALCAAAVGAQAQVTGSLGGPIGSFLELSSAGLAGGTVATLSGGTIYNSDKPFADIPKSMVVGGNFLAAGPSSGNPATLTFTGSGVDAVSFLWGSPDTYNLLSVGYTGGSMDFTTASLGLPGNGDQTISSYVTFNATGASKITSLRFTSPTDAFESANYSVAAVPEPETYALMLAGLGVVGFLARRRKAA